MTGKVAVVLLALAGFQLSYAWQARQYGLLVLVGVAAAVTADHWLRRPQSRQVWLVAALLTVGELMHLSAVLLALGLLAIPGLRRDRAAWQWRAGIAGASTVFVLLWLPALIDQSHSTASHWIPFTNWTWLSGTVNELVDYFTPVAGLVCAAVLFGGLLLRAQDRALGRVWWCCVGIPIGVAAMAGLRVHLVQPRLFAVVSWGPALALGAVVERAFKQWRPIGVATLCLLAVIVLPTTWREISDPQAGRRGGWEYAIAHLEQVSKPGDAIVSAPAYMRPPTEWYLGPLHAPRQILIAGMPGTAFARGSGNWNGRTVWLVEPMTTTFAPAGWSACAPRWTSHGYEVRCFSRGSG
jgi:uncharacterized membrane protein